ncbi:tetratricopeptide repeat protein [Ekhidna sp.]|uniref:tetratricopeptide repeat protein n=1 Tax=Ekhidna sp. TaxID=2608089 RepID=UPI003298E6E2
MPHKIIIFFISTLIAIQGNAQLRPFLDSLKNDLNTVTDDSLRFRVLDELAWTYKRVDADSALMYAAMEIEVAKKLANEQFMAFGYSNIGVIKKENELDDYGIKDLHKSLAINKRLGNQRGIASNSNNIGNSYELIGKYDSAIKYFTRSIQIKLEIGQEASAASTMSNLGLVYHQMNNPEKAIEYYDEALSIVGEESRRARGIFNNLGISYMKLEEYEKARKYLRKAISGMEILSNKRNFASTYGNIGETFYNEGNYDSALFYAEKAFTIKKEFGENLSLTYPAISLAKIYIKLSQFDKAKENAELAFRIASNSSSMERKAESTFRLGVVEANMKNFERAATLFYDYSLIQDSINNENVIRLAEETEAKFQNELKEKENQILKEEAIIREQKIQTQNLLIIGAIIIVLLLVIIALLLREQLTERKNLLTKIKSQSEKLKELDQAKTRFFANISHDLRSPLTLILGSLDKITERDYEILDQESKELLDMGIKNGKRLLYLADEIMDLTRLEEGKVSLELQYVKIVPYLRLLTKMFSSAADIKSIELKFSTHAEDETTLKIDPHQFEKIIYNLLSNAIKFTPDNGVVDVQLNTDQDHLNISISDSGPGIPPESLELIFDRYYQSSDANTSQAGVGIGLALVKELVELHGGSIKASSGPNGSVFTIRFPFKKSDWISKAIVPERSLDVVTRNSLWMDLQDEKQRLQVPGIKTAKENAKTVLIVEDHRELRSYLQSILSADFRVYLAVNGSSALDMLQAEKIDLIITDLMMPYMDGFELVDHLKKDKELKKIPVVVVSARTDKKEKLDLIAKGAEDVISKPFDKEELTLKIQNILSRDWDSNKVFSKLYGETAEEFEKNIMQRLEKLIIKRIDDPHLSVLDLADEMAASERKVYRLIKKISGLTPYELIKEVRWQYLENYLSNNKVRTATEAAQIIGMNNVSSFASQYEKRFGHSFKEVIGE